MEKKEKRKRQKNGEEIQTLIISGDQVKETIKALKEKWGNPTEEHPPSGNSSEYEISWGTPKALSTLLTILKDKNYKVIVKCLVKKPKTGMTNKDVIFPDAEVFKQDMEIAKEKNSKEVIHLHPFLNSTKLKKLKKLCCFRCSPFDLEEEVNKMENTTVQNFCQQCEAKQIISLHTPCLQAYKKLKNENLKLEKQITEILSQKTCLSEFSTQYTQQKDTMSSSQFSSPSHKSNLDEKIEKKEEETENKDVNLQNKSKLEEEQKQNYFLINEMIQNFNSVDGLNRTTEDEQFTSEKYSTSVEEHSELFRKLNQKLESLIFLCPSWKKDPKSNPDDSILSDQKISFMTRIDSAGNEKLNLVYSYFVSGFFSLKEKILKKFAQNYKIGKTKEILDTKIEGKKELKHQIQLNHAIVLSSSGELNKKDEAKKIIQDLQILPLTFTNQSKSSILRAENVNISCERAFAKKKEERDNLYTAIKKMNESIARIDEILENEEFEKETIENIEKLLKDEYAENIEKIKEILKYEQFPEETIHSIREKLEDKEFEKKKFLQIEKEKRKLFEQLKKRFVMNYTHAIIDMEIYKMYLEQGQNEKKMAQDRKNLLNRLKLLVTQNEELNYPRLWAYGLEPFALAFLYFAWKGPNFCKLIAIDYAREMLQLIKNSPEFYSNRKQHVDKLERLMENLKKGMPDPFKEFYYGEELKEGNKASENQLEEEKKVNENNRNNRNNRKTSLMELEVPSGKDEKMNTKRPYREVQSYTEDDCKDAETIQKKVNTSAHK